MATLEDDRTELENYPLTYWQPVKMIPKCRCYTLKLPLPHYESWSAGLTGGSLWQWCSADTTHCYNNRDDWLSVHALES